MTSLSRIIYVSNVILALIAIHPLMSEATPTPIEEDQRVELAQEAMSKALIFIKEKKYADAAESLDLSYRTYPSNQALHLLGRLYDKIPTECVRSVAAWQMLLKRCHDECELRTDALAKLKSSELECEGQLLIKSEPTHVEVFINNKKVGITPFNLSLIARSHDLVLLKDGYKPINRQITLQRGWSSTELTIELTSNRKNRGAEHALPSAESLRDQQSPTPHVKVDLHPPSSSPLKATEPPKNTTPSWHVKFGANEDPFTRLPTLPPIKQGKIAISGERSLISRLNCQYRSRLQRYLPQENCDGSRVAPYDRFFVSILPQQSSYIYLVMSNDKGQWQLLFPEEGESNLFKANELTSIPKKEWILFDEMRNTIDEISLIASPRPIPELEAEKGRSSSKGLSANVMKYFVPMAQPYSGQPIKSSRILQAQTKYVLDHPQVLHTSFEVYR